MKGSIYLNRRVFVMYFREKFLFYHENLCCMYSLQSSHRCDSYGYTQQYIMLKKIEMESPNYSDLPPNLILRLFLCGSNYQRHGPKDVRAIEVQLCIDLIGVRERQTFLTLINAIKNNFRLKTSTYPFLDPI